MRRVIAAASVVVALTGCTNTVHGVAVKSPTPSLSVENFVGDESSLVFRDIFTDLVGYWKSQGVELTDVRFSQWDSARGDDPPMCHGSVFPQPAFCSEGWLSWDNAWARRALQEGMAAPVMFSTRAVSDAVAYALGKPYGELSSVRTQECLMGAYMATRAQPTPNQIRLMLTNVSAFVSGLESPHPSQDCLYV